MSVEWLEHKKRSIWPRGIREEEDRAGSPRVDLCVLRTLNIRPTILANL